MASKAAIGGAGVDNLAESGLSLSANRPELRIVESLDTSALALYSSASSWLPLLGYSAFATEPPGQVHRSGA